MWTLGNNRNARLFIGVSLVMGFGTTAMSLVASVWVLSLTGSAGLASLAGLCLYAPTLVGPLLGAIVDRWPREKTLIWTCLTLAAALMLLLAVRSARDVWLLYAVMLGYGVSYVVLGAAEAALLPLALPDEALGQVNGLRMGAREGVKLVAPLAAAGLFAWKGNGQPVAALAAIALVVSAGLYAMVQAGRRPLPTAQRMLVQQIREGLDFLWRQPTLRACVLVAAVAVAMSGLMTAAMYVFVTHDLQRAPEFLGVLASAQGAGSIVGGVGVGWVMRRLGERATAVAGILLFAAATLTRCVASTPLAVVGSVLIGVGLPWTLVAAMTAVQRLTAADMVSSVAATVTTLVFAPTAVAMAIGAALPGLADHRIVLVSGALVCVVAGMAAASDLSGAASDLPT